MAYSPQDVLTDRFQDALLYALQLHKNQVRKNKNIPYFAHLMSVTALVMEAGGDEEETIAALLHDAVEDQGGHHRLRDIRDQFGDRVADIVDGCTDAYKTPKPPWQERKKQYLSQLSTASPSIILVSLADKVHNARSIYRDLTREGSEIWENFNGGKEGTLWYYHELTVIFSQHQARYPALVREFIALVKDIQNFTENME